jgi:hypothetical protein
MHFMTAVYYQQTDCGYACSRNTQLRIQHSQFNLASIIRVVNKLLPLFMSSAPNILEIQVS